MQKVKRMPFSILYFYGTVVDSMGRLYMVDGDAV